MDILETMNKARHFDEITESLRVWVVQFRFHDDFLNKDRVAILATVTKKEFVDQIINDHNRDGKFKKEQYFFSTMLLNEPTY